MSVNTLTQVSLPESLSALLFLALCRSLKGRVAVLTELIGQFGLAFGVQHIGCVDKLCGEYVGDGRLAAIVGAIWSDECDDCEVGDEDEEI